VLLPSHPPAPDAVHFESAKIQALYRFDDKMYKVAFEKPFPQILWKQQRGNPVYIEKSYAH
jgi:hypothetical protein